MSALESKLSSKLRLEFVLMFCFVLFSLGHVSPAGLARADDDPKKKTSAGWPVFRGNAQSSGVATTNLPTKLDVVWEFKVPQGLSLIHI